MKLSEERESLILANEALVHHLVQKKIGIKSTSPEYEEIASVGILGLTKAASFFDYSKKCKFATYASKCILNEIYMYFRKNNKYIKNISIDEIIAEDGAGGELTLEQKLEDNNSDFLDKILLKDELSNLISIILNCLRGRHRIATLYKIGGKNQNYIAKKLNISRSYVSRIEMESISKIKKCITTKGKGNGVFSMKIIEDEYIITFSTKDIKDFNKILSRTLNEVESIGNLPNFKIKQNKEQVLIQLDADEESFNFIAQIIQEIDEYSIAYTSNKIKPCKGALNLKKGEKIKLDKESMDRMSKNSRILLEYMLSKGTFTVRELKQQFEDVSDSIIANTLYRFKASGIIISESRGKYKVIKD